MHPSQYVTFPTLIGALEGIIDLVQYPGAEMTLDSFTTQLNTEINLYWFNYNNMIDDIITKYISLRDETKSLEEEYYYNAIIDYCEKRKGDQWRY